MIAASTDEDQGDAVVIVLNGDDTYLGAPLGLATRRLGVALLIDLDVDDVYQLDLGSRARGSADSEPCSTRKATMSISALA
jgi:hypothetical protein